MLTLVGPQDGEPAQERDPVEVRHGGSSSMVVVLVVLQQWAQAPGTWGAAFSGSGVAQRAGLCRASQIEPYQAA